MISIFSYNILYIIMFVFNVHFNMLHKHRLDINKKPVDIIALSPPPLQIYYSVNKYSKEYDIPRSYMFRMLHEETRYNNPLSVKYNHAQTSNMNAEGPAQLLLKTARWISNDDSITKSDIRHNVELNIELSAKFLKWIYDHKTHNWGYVFNYYNTGYLSGINKYAKNITRI